MKRQEKRSERFYANKNQNRKLNNPHKNKKYRKTSPRRRYNIRRKRRNNKGLVYVFFIFVIALIAFTVTKKSPEETFNSGIEAIKEANISKEEKIFDKMDEVSQTMAKYYSDDKSVQDEFLKSAFYNLDAKIVSVKESKNGIYIIAEISNVNYMKIYNDLDYSADLDSVYFDSLKNSSNVEKTEAEVLLVKKFHGYKICESEEFINACIGGALNKN
ncbi:MAG: hypothetical protein Q4B36_03505 [Tissierellia bacterium]|nr:hypothetical protein [Tissierellia bacterium]